MLIVTKLSQIVHCAHAHVVSFKKVRIVMVLTVKVEYVYFFAKNSYSLRKVTKKLWRKKYEKKRHRH